MMARNSLKRACEFEFESSSAAFFDREARQKQVDKGSARQGTDQNSTGRYCSGPLRFRLSGKPVMARSPLLHDARMDKGRGKMTRTWTVGDLQASERLENHLGSLATASNILEMNAVLDLHKQAPV